MSTRPSWIPMMMLLAPLVALVAGIHGPRIRRLLPVRRRTFYIVVPCLTDAHVIRVAGWSRLSVSCRCAQEQDIPEILRVFGSGGPTVTCVGWAQRLMEASEQDFSFLLDVRDLGGWATAVIGDTPQMVELWNTNCRGEYWQTIWHQPGHRRDRRQAPSREWADAFYDNGLLPPGHPLEDRWRDLGYTANQVVTLYPELCRPPRRLRKQWAAAATVPTRRVTSRPPAGTPQ